MRCPICHSTSIFVYARNQSCSAFNGYRTTWSAFSKICCRACRNIWKSKSARVADLPDGALESAFSQQEES